MLLTLSLLPFTRAYAGVDPIPSCTACTSEYVEYWKPYAIDPLSGCDTSVPKRLCSTLHTKRICANGGYWLCEDTSTTTCSAYIARPACPDNTCNP
jgi:hypothetical protein